MQSPCIFGRTRHVIATVDDNAGDAVKLMRIAQKLAFFKPAFVDEIVVFDAGEGERIVLAVERIADRGIGEERDG